MFAYAFMHTLDVVNCSENHDLGNNPETGKNPPSVGNAHIQSLERPFFCLDV